MKANRKFINKDAGISAVIGVILMVAITIAISCTVYAYISNMMFNPTFNTFTGKLNKLPIKSHWHKGDSIIFDNLTFDFSYISFEDYSLLKLAYIGGYNISFVYYYDASCGCGQEIFDILDDSVTVLI